MELMLINFDEQFSRYIKEWLKKNTESIKNMDEVEAKMPQIYSEWLDSPQEFLSGKKPNEYFLTFSPEELINLLIRYEAKSVGVPDPLLDAIASKKDSALPYLSEIAFGSVPLPKGADAVATQIMALNLIEEIDPSSFVPKYIDAICDKTLDSGAAEIMTESIKHNASGYKDLLINSIENSDSTTVKKRLIDILCEVACDKRIYEEIVSLFKSSDEKALFASYLGKYGDEDAIEILSEALNWVNINYLDYLEIRNAIEELGQEVTHVRNFDGDKYFESMKRL